MATFGERLKHLRSKNNLNQDELASKINKKKDSISKYEHNKAFPEMPILIKIADYFKVSIDYLLGRSDIRQIKEEITNDELNLINIYKELDPNTKKEVVEFIKFKQSQITQNAKFTTSTKKKKKGIKNETAW